MWVVGIQPHVYTLHPLSHLSSPKDLYLKGQSQGQRRLTYSISLPSTAQSPNFCALNSGKFYCSIMNCSSRQKLLEDAANGGQKHIRHREASSLVPQRYNILRYKENDQRLTAPRAGSLRSRGLGLLFFLQHDLSTATREQSGNNRLGSCSHQQTVYCKRVAGSKANSQPETESIQINSIPSLLRKPGTRHRENQGEKLTRVLSEQPRAGTSLCMSTCPVVRYCQG